MLMKIPALEKVLKVKDDKGHEHASDGKFTGTGGGSGKGKGKDKITTDNKAVIEDYKRTGYAKINAHLRRGDKANMSPKERAKAMESISRLEKIIDGAPLSNEIQVFRGIGDPEIYKNFDKLVGAVISDAGFVSTSSSVDLAAQHARSANMGIRQKQKPKRGIIAVIKLPKGIKAISLGQDDSEQETIIQHGSKFKVTSTDKTGPYWRVDLEAIA